MPLFRRRPRVLDDPDAGIVPDDVPKRGLFAEPIVVTRLDPKEPETIEDGSHRIVFRAVIKDAEGRRCPDLAVEASMTGPERTASGTGTTDLMGAIVFRMVGPAGCYTIQIDDVAAGGLDLDRDASVLEAATEIGALPEHQAEG